jgi:rhamnose utilization protein RhaD (predicted bifunctional aldolase and dehydrogenase)
MLTSALQALVELSARIGQDLNLVQAGGGNTSLKADGELWIKASGKWLAHAEHDDMFVPVPLATIAEKLTSGDEAFTEYRTRSGVSLRPSVETTMHAVLPHPVVIHVHSAATIACAVQRHGEEFARTRLYGIRWAFIPYIHPGVPLAQRVQRELIYKPDVLILGNHGLVVAGSNCDEAERLLHEVERRLAVEPHNAPAPDREALRQLSHGTEWQAAANDEVHALGTDSRLARIAAGGTMYPDHCVYLGPAAPLLREGESIERALKHYRNTYAYEPAFLLVEHKGVLTSSKLSRAGQELLVCLKRVTERIPAEAEVRYLENWQVAKLMNWDAEKYRIAMAQRQAEQT